MKNKNPKYLIKSNDFEFRVETDDIINTDIQKISNQEYSIIKDSISYNGSTIHSDFFNKKYSVLLEGEIFEIQIKDELDQLIDALGFASVKNKTLSNIKAPMPGLVLEIAVENDQEVNEGDKLIILEAMKMENVIKIPAAAKIKEVLVKKGQAVEKGQILIELY